ncbi:MAG: hypothetical protein KDJ16_05980 [Hyphomicrobiales bacterium]|nr:hypothetical protein [Hyphomicrobiales bacterium]
MGRILYGVLGDRGGHLARSIAIARQLPDHEFLFIGDGRVEEVTRHGFAFQRSPMIGTELRNGRLDVAATIAEAVKGLADGRRTLARLEGLIRDFDPDLIVTDYEFFLPRAARRLGRPCISIDRHHALTNCRYSKPPGHLATRALALSILNGMYMAASRYMVVSFAPLEPIDPAITEVFPPVVRRDLDGVMSSDGDHAVVYLYGLQPAQVRRMFAGRKRRFVIYGMGIDGEDGNLSFRRHSTDGFLADLTSAAYVVSHGGHNLISEALHFRKPLIAFPLGFEYEQYFNAWQLQETGYGASGNTRAAAASIDRFEAELDRYRERLADYRPWSQQTITGRLDEMIRAGR